jgi:hypothetical protein
LGLALLFTRGTRQIHRLYAFDLFGAGVGCAAIALVIPAFGGSGSVVVAATIGLLAAAVLRWARREGWQVFAWLSVWLPSPSPLTAPCPSL